MTHHQQTELPCKSSPAKALPDIARLPDEALLTRRQVKELSGFSLDALKKWAREGEGRGPAVIYVEGRPRTTARAYREWIASGRKASGRKAST